MCMSVNEPIHKLHVFTRSTLMSVEHAGGPITNTCNLSLLPTYLTATTYYLHVISDLQSTLGILTVCSLPIHTEINKINKLANASIDKTRQTDKCVLPPRIT